MSFVAAYITEHFVVMSGDRRAVHIDDHDVYFDAAPKLFQINDRVLYGLTGDYHLSLKLRKHIEKLDLQNTRPNEFARLCRRWLQRRSKSDSQQTVTIAGLDAKGKPIIVQVSHRNDYKPEYVSVESEHMEWRLAYANTDPAPFINEELEKYEVLNVESCALLAKTVNERVASEDSFVSAVCDVAYIAVK